MQRLLAVLAVLAAPLALAEGDLVSTITAAGASARAAVSKGSSYELQCNGDARFRTGDSTVAASNTDGAATKGRKVLADALVAFETESSQTHVAVIPADGASTIKCDVFLRVRPLK